MAVPIVRVAITLVNERGKQIDRKMCSFENPPDGFGVHLTAAVAEAAKAWSYALGDTITIREVT